MEGPKRGAQDLDAKRRRAEGVWGRSHSPLSFLEAMPPEKFSKVNVEIAYRIYFL